MSEYTVKKQGRRLRGRVVGDRADKTVRVEIERQIKHPLYGKTIRRNRDVQAHDEDNSCRIGDVVVLEEMRRVSKTKAWRVAERTARKEAT